MDDEALALELQPLLKGARGFAPSVPHICAAILMVRDSTLSSREACRRIAGVSEGARDVVAALVPKVRTLFDEGIIGEPPAEPVQPAALGQAVALGPPVSSGGSPSCHPLTKCRRSPCWALRCAP